MSLNSAGLAIEWWFGSLIESLYSTAKSQTGLKISDCDDSVIAFHQSVLKI